jgi:PAS domain S-box-containing protein
MLKSLLAKPLRIGLLLLAAIAALSVLAPEFWRKLFSTQGFMPHGHCYLWRPEVVWLHVGSDLLIGLSYVAISTTLAYLVHKARRDIPFHWMILGFGLFIVACGGTHFMEVWTLWQPRYWLSGDVKLITAAASLTTAFSLPPLIPKVLAMIRDAKLSKERKQQLESANRELETLNARLKELDEHKMQFFANVSHELRTPLTLVLGPTERMLAAGGLTEEQRRGLEVVDRNARTLLKHVTDLLDIAKLDAGKMTVNFASVDLVRLLRATAAYFESLAREKKIELTVVTPESVVTRADPEKLQRVFLNLLSNAFKFTPAGRPIRCVLRAEPDRAVIEFEDSGPGVPANLCDAIFERFRQGEGHSTRRFGGTGLGLSIAKEFVELHHGEITVSDAPGGGALFRVELPLVAQAESPTTASVGSGDTEFVARQTLAQLSPASTRSEALAPSTTGHGSVLVVEDNLDMNRFITETLSDNHSVASAFNGREGLEKALQLRPDVIVTDLMMPEMSGDQLVRKARECPELNAVPIIVLTAKAEAELCATLLREGAQDYLRKPFSAEELQARIGNLVSMKRARQFLQEELASQSENLAELAVDLIAHKRELQKSLDSLSQNERRLRRIVDSNMVGILFWRADGQVTDANDAFLTLAGYTRQDLVQGCVNWQEITPPEYRAEDQRALDEMAVRGACTPYEKEYLRKDGRRVPVLIGGALLEGTADRGVRFAIDLTERKKAEQAFREGEALKSAILESALDSIIAIDHEGKIIEWNRSAEQTFGYRREEALGREMGEMIIPPSMRESHRQGLARLGATGEGRVLGRRIEMTALRSDGSEFPAELTITPIHREGTPAFTGYVRDITERKRAEESLRQSEARKSAILESALDAILTIDQTGTIQEWNPAAEKIFGYRKPEALGRKVDALIIPPAMKEIYQDGLAEYLMTGVGSLLGRPIELTVMRASGTEFRAELAITRHSLDEPTLYTCFVRDITERKRAEETRNQLAAIVASSDDAIISKTLQGRIVSWNIGAERMFGHSAAEVIGEAITVLIPPEFLDEEAQILGKIKRGERIQHYETVRRRKDGSRIDVSLTISPIKEATGRVIGASKIARDITERKRAEAEIRKLNEELERRVVERTAQLEAINQELGSFTYSVSHDLRAPLRALQGLSNALLEDYAERLDDLAKDYCQRIVTAAGRMDTLIQDLLAYSRLSRVDLALKAIDLTAVTADVQHQLESDLKERQAELIVPDALPAVLGHRATLGQVLSNLVSNAIKFVAPGVKPEVRIRAEERGEFVRLWVEDNGIGIAPEYRDRIFRIFERLHGVETYPGTGIGLAIVQKGAERLGGQAGVESVEGAGSRFWIELKKG